MMVGRGLSGTGTVSGAGTGGCHVGVTVVAPGGWLQCLLGCSCDAGVLFISLGEGTVPCVLSCLPSFWNNPDCSFFWVWVLQSFSGRECHSESNWCYV